MAKPSTEQLRRDRACHHLNEITKRCSDARGVSVVGQDFVKAVSHHAEQAAYSLLAMRDTDPLPAALELRYRDEGYTLDEAG